MSFSLRRDALHLSSAHIALETATLTLDASTLHEHPFTWTV
jgi:hypothetical protein